MSEATPAAKDELFDSGLQGIFGSHYSEVQPPKPTAKRAEPATKNKTVEANWEPVKEPVWTDRLRDTVKKIAVFAAICLWLFYLQQSKLMDSDTAYRAMIVCNLLAGLSIGKAVWGT